MVVMDATYNRDGILQMLNDEEFYFETKEDMDSQTSKMINKLLEEHGESLFEEEAGYLTIFKHNTSYFYGLPKIHKSNLISEAIKLQNAEYIQMFQPSDLKFRPIIGGPNNPTQILSHLLDLILKPICPEVPSFVKDDKDFLHHLPESTEKGTKLVTFDVTSLCTNIPHDFGEKAVSHWLEKCRDKVDSNFKDEFIINGLNIILKRNMFYLDGKFYIQKTGTAMSTKVGPTYAILVMGCLEEQLLEKLDRKYGSEISGHFRKKWIRFLDDCFILWNSTIPVDKL